MQHAKLYILYQYSVKGYPVHTCKKCYDPICVHHHFALFLVIFFGNPICVCSWSLQYGKSHYSLFIQRSMLTGVTIGLPDTLPCCCPTAATAPSPLAPLFPPLIHQSIKFVSTAVNRLWYVICCTACFITC